MMTGGESKHVSLLKDFGLYPQAFLGALDSKDGVKNVWDCYEDTMNVFNVKNIDETLKKNKKIYMDYLVSTTR